MDTLDENAVARVKRRWPSILVFNLLEHVYDPPAALRNSIRLLEPGGTCVVAGPAVWQLHDFPADCWRPLPDFFSEFARPETISPHRRPTQMAHTRKDDFGQRDDLSRRAEIVACVVPRARQRYLGVPKATVSRAIHKLFRTYGRQAAFPYVGLGVALRKPR